MKSIKIFLLIFVGIAISACSNSPEWINVGDMISIAEKDPKQIKDIPYRLFNLNTKIGEIKKTTDVVDLTLAIQSGEALGKLAMVYAVFCLNPDITRGVPTVYCVSESDKPLYLSGNEKLRSQLLHIEKGRQIGAVIGRVVGEFRGIPIIIIL